MLTRALLLAAAVAAPACAQATDGRIRSVFYRADAITTIAGRPNIQSAILFAPDEHIENVAIGDSAAWQVTPNKRADLLFVKPQAPRGRTNLTVITDQRTYLFDLVAQPGGPALYTLRFTYPPAPPKPVAATPAAAVAPSPPAPSPADLNFAWQPGGAKPLLPRRVYDDGQSVFLSWSPDVGVPALLELAPDGKEGPVNYTVKGDTVVVDGVPGRLVLRAGRQVATLDRAVALAPVLHTPPTQTAER